MYDLYPHLLLFADLDTVLTQWNANPDEVIQSIATVKLPETDVTVFVVATYTPDPEEVEVHEGRILLFSAERSSVAKMSSEKYQLTMLTSTAIDGCPASLTVTTDGMLVAAVNASVRDCRVSYFYVLTCFSGPVVFHQHLQESRATALVFS